MDIIRIPRIMRDILSKERMRGRRIGLVPTMGALHEGHLSLMRTCRAENDISIASIFINPIQFGPKEDLDRYPRDIDGDTEKLRSLGIDLLFMPDPSSMYPEGFSTTVSAGETAKRLCGASRPGHFDGVSTVVVKLFNIAGPDRAYFGAKDYQQTVIIKKTVKDLNIPIEIVVCPTVRESDGLAMSSRNAYLTPKERKAAAVLHKSLELVCNKVKSGIINVIELKGLFEASLRSEPLVLDIDYASIYDPVSLMELKTVEGEAVAASAIRIGSTRLIDNMPVKR